MTTSMTSTHAARSGLRRALPSFGLLLALAACSSILDVKNPNNVPEDALANPAAAGAQASGVLASLVRMLSGVTVPYAVATDELDWIGSRDAWNDLETGAIANYLNEFNDGVFGYVGEVRYLGDDAISRDPAEHRNHRCARGPDHAISNPSFGQFIAVMQEIRFGQP